jgi:L-alanine-DL-glutamate epimerase-like enolase superfamily enzyme
VAAAFAEETMIEYSYAELGASPLGSAIEVKGGFIDVPSRPGLGCDPDPEVLRKYGN